MYHGLVTFAPHYNDKDMFLTEKEFASENSVRKKEI